MSGFDPDWLALRETADDAARNPVVLAACAAHFVARETMSIVDLGCGAGSNLRALAPHLGARQHWRLVDHDPALLDAARRTLADWADNSAAADGGLHLTKGGKTIDVDFVRADLAHGVGAAFDGACDLVTAAALFDLVSERWMRALARLLADRRLPLYAALTYTGVERWSPAHPADSAILAAFHAHQARDKGFGDAAGPTATSLLSDLLVRAGYASVEGASDWALRYEANPALIEHLANGIVAACRETGLAPAAQIDAWLAARRGADAIIGHTDIFATPG